MGFPVSGCAGVWVCWYLRVVFLLTLVCLCLPACLGCLPASVACRPRVPAGLGCLPACPPRCLPALLAWVPAGLACMVPAGLACLSAGRPCLLACRPALLACLGARPPLNVSTTRGTVPLAMVTAPHDRIPSQPYRTF